MGAHDLHAGITPVPINASTRGQPKAVSGVDGELVISAQANDEPWPLVWPDWDCPVSFFDITHRSLGPRR